MTTPRALFEAISRRDGEGIKISATAVDLLLQVKASDEETGGALFVAEEVCRPKSGPPLHIHRTQTEMFYFLQGTFEVQIGDKRTRHSPGDFLVVPPLVPHTFRNIGETLGHFLFALTPGAGAHDFFRRFAAASKDGPPSPEQLAALAQSSDIEFVGPPISD